MLNGLDSYFAARTQALDLRARRSEILASNIANADTPGYKARDLDFAAQLNAALSRGDAQHAGIAMQRTSARHLGAVPQVSPAVDLKYRIPVQSSIDGNTVEMDSELAQFSDNALRYQADITFLSSQIRWLQAAVAA